MIGNIIIIILNLLWVTFGIESVFKKQNKLGASEIVFLQRLFVFHVVVSLAFSAFISKNGGDPMDYWSTDSWLNVSDRWGYYYKPGTSFMVFLCFPLSRYFNINFYMGGLLFGLIGHLGFIYIYIIVRKFLKRRIILLSTSIFPLILYSPNLNFWSAGIGKDSLCFFAILLYFYCLFNIRKKWFWALFALVLSYHIRPHIALFLAVATFGAIIFDSRVKLGVKVAMIIFMFGATGLLFNKVLNFLKLDDVNSTSIEKFSSSKSKYLAKGAGSAVDMSSYPLPLKVFTFLYRPLFIDSPNALGLIQSCENMVLLWLTLLVLKESPFKTFIAAPYPIKAMVIFALIAATGFSLILGNLGIMAREKIPVIGCLLIFVLWSLHYNREIRLRRRKRIIERKLAEQAAKLDS